MTSQSPTRKPSRRSRAQTVSTLGASRTAPCRWAAACSPSTAVGPPRSNPAFAAAPHVAGPSRYRPWAGRCHWLPTRERTSGVTPARSSCRVARTPSCRAASARTDSGRDCRGIMRRVWSAGAAGVRSGRALTTPRPLQWELCRRLRRQSSHWSGRGRRVGDDRLGLPGSRGAPRMVLRPWCVRPPAPVQGSDGRVRSVRAGSRRVPHQSAGVY